MAKKGSMMHLKLMKKNIPVKCIIPIKRVFDTLDFITFDA